MTKSMAPPPPTRDTQAHTETTPHDFGKRCERAGRVEQDRPCPVGVLVADLARGVDDCPLLATGRVSSGAATVLYSIDLERVVKAGVK